MTSQPVSSVSSCVKVASFIRGYHCYVWQPVVEVLLLQRELSNMKDSQAVSVMKVISSLDMCQQISLLFFSHFLPRTCNKGTAEVTGARVNWGMGHGLQISCKYRAAYLVRLDTTTRDIQVR